MNPIRLVRSCFYAMLAVLVLGLVVASAQQTATEGAEAQPAAQEATPVAPPSPAGGTPLQYVVLDWAPHPAAAVPPCKSVSVYLNPKDGVAPKGAPPWALYLYVIKTDRNGNPVDAKGNPLQPPIDMKALVYETSGTVLITDQASPAKDASPDQAASKQTIATITLGKQKGVISLPSLTVSKHILVATLEGTDKTNSTSSPQEDVTVEPSEATGECIQPMPPMNMSLIGINIEGASSTSPAATFLGMNSLEFPLIKRGGANPLSDVRDVHAFFTGVLRIAGMAQPGALSASAFASGYYASAINATPDKIVQSWEGSVSFSFPLLSATTAEGTFDNGTPASKDSPRGTIFTIGPMIIAGFNSPLSATQAAPPVYYLTSQIMNLNANPNPRSNGAWPSSCSYTSGNPPCYVSFVPNDRTRFYRYYEAGFRVRVYGEDFDHKMLRYPGTADLTVGQNEYVTGGGLRGVVAHISGVMPIPIPKVDGVYAFGSISSELNGRIGGGPQLLLSPVPSTANVNYLSTSVYDISVPQPDRDRYRFGVGIDLIHLLTAKKDAATTTSNSKTTSQ